MNTYIETMKKKIIGLGVGLGHCPGPGNCHRTGANRNKNESVMVVDSYDDDYPVDRHHCA